MIRLAIILLLFSTQLSAQNPHFPIVSISVPCTEEFVNNYKGKWLNPLPLPNGVNDYHDEVIIRLNQIQNLVHQTYPQPIGNDVSWSSGIVKSSFADEVKYVLVRKDEWEAQSVIKIPVYRYQCGLTLCSWMCHGEKQIMNGYPEIGEGGLEIQANRLYILSGNFPEGEEWTIDGRPIKQKMPTMGSWKGCELMSTVGSQFADASTTRIVLITRDGVQPYIPITRKQYLERAVISVTKFFDKLMAISDQITDQSERDAYKSRNVNEKDIGLKKLQDELEKTTKDGLLDSPAIVRPDALIQFDGPVFLSEAEGGIMLATENPAYFRKDLPKYIPQFFVLELTWGNKPWSQEFKRIIEENFPIEKLKAMIDK